MLTPDTRVHYIGFHPSETTEALMMEWAQELHDEAPNGANVKMVVSRIDRTYQTEIRITSRAGHFHTLCKGPNLYLANKDAVKKVRRQLKKWKTIRHSQHYDDIPQIQTG